MRRVKSIYWLIAAHLNNLPRPEHLWFFYSPISSSAFDVWARLITVIGDAAVAAVSSSASVGANGQLRADHMAAAFFYSLASYDYDEKLFIALTLTLANMLSNVHARCFSTTIYSAAAAATATAYVVGLL